MFKTVWKYVILGTVMMLLLGIVYSYSMFRLEIETVYDVGEFQGGLPYMFSLFFYALFMAIGGRLFQRISTFSLSLVGVFLIGGGFVLASLWESIFGLTIAYGFMIGSGVGILYALPLRIISQLSYSRPGYLIGITLMGFGLSPLIFAPTIEALIASQGLSTTFLLLGITYIILLLGLLLPLTNRDTAPKTTGKRSYPMLKDPAFYLLYALFFIGTFIGLTIIGLTGDIGVEEVGLSTTQVAFYIGLFAILNGIGRPIFGYLNDHIGFIKTAFITYVVLIVGSLLLLFGGQTLAIFIVSISMIYIIFGGWLSLAPSATITLFGRKDYTQNYGVMFTAYGFGALLGSGIGGLLVQYIGYQSLYIMLGTLAIIGFLVLLWKKQLIQSKKS